MSQITQKGSNRVEAVVLPGVPRTPVRAALAAAVIPWLLSRVNTTEESKFILDRPRSFYRRLGGRGLIGFGEAYQAGDWHSDDLAGLLTVIAERIDAAIPWPLRRIRRLIAPRRRNDEENTIDGARRNIHRHYDMSNDLFALFLDETMTYSSALFEADSSGRPISAAELLAQAQIRKVDRLLDAVGVGPGSHMLEIGTGWGTLAIRAARRGARVRSITISAEQHALAMQRITDAGLATLVDVEICDYREVRLPMDLRAGYDAVVSVEMIEAVGERYWPAYFTAIDRLLAPHGLVGLQAITTRPDRLAASRKTHSWMNEYIFPGGQVPSIPAIETVLKRHTELQVTDRFAFGAHYAQTLRLWRQRFNAQAGQIEKMGFSEVFRRTWELYFALCEAGFRSGYLDVYQLVLGRPASASAQA